MNHRITRLLVISMLLMGCMATEHSESSFDAVRCDSTTDSSSIVPLDIDGGDHLTKETNATIDLAPDASSGPCVPDCAWKDCGDDGCGGSCGDCWQLTCLDPLDRIYACIEGLCMLASDAYFEGCAPHDSCLNDPDECGPCPSCLDLDDVYVGTTEYKCQDGMVKLTWSEDASTPDCQIAQMHACIATCTYGCADLPEPVHPYEEGYEYGDEHQCSGNASEVARCYCGCDTFCEGKECGDDGCGGSCGDCPGDTVCDEFMCVLPVAP